MITIHDVLQGTDEWLELRRGMITASELKLLITPTLRRAENDKARAHLYELAAQRITGHVEPHYISDDMLRGHDDEVLARRLYSGRYAPVQEVGFVTNDSLGFSIGCSPDGFVGSDGQIEIKSRRSKYQVQTAIDGVVPVDFYLQVQGGLLVTGREWCDFISYSGGMHMIVIREYADKTVHATMARLLDDCEGQIRSIVERYNERVAARGWHMTERTEREIIV